MVDVLTLDDLDTMSDAERQARARDHYLASLALGYRMSGAELGKKFRRSPRWGRLQIAEAKQETREPSPVLPDTEPALPPVWTPPAEEPEASTPEPVEPSLPPVVTPPAEHETAPRAVPQETTPTPPGRKTPKARTAGTRLSAGTEQGQRRE